MQICQKPIARRLPAVVLSTVVCSALAAATASAACTRSGPPDARIEDCTRVIRTVPAGAERVSAYVIRGEAFAVKGMDGEALRDFTAALQGDPGQRQALIGRGRTRIARREYEAAIADLSLALKQAPKGISILILRGYAFLASNKSNLAVDDFSLALVLDPGNVLALNTRGLAYKKLGKHDLAIADFTQAVSRNPLYALAYGNRGYALEAMGRKQAAIEDFKRALTIDPTLSGVQARLKRLAPSSLSSAASSKQIAQGRALAQKNCAWCHAIDGSGKSKNTAAPAFRDIQDRYPVLSLRSPISRAIATPHDAMPKFTMSDEDVDRVIAYINSLGTAR